MIGQNGKTMLNHNTNESGTIALVDSSISLKDVKNLIKKKTPSKIITFDYKSHKILLENKIPHEISDNYIQQDELESIQKNCYHFSKWAQLSPFKKSMDYQGFNVGNYFYQEIFVLLLPLLKKLVEVQNICQKYQRQQLWSIGLLKKIEGLFNKLEKIEEEQIQANVEFLYDHINLQNNRLAIKLSRSNYFKIKNLLEKNIDVFFGSNKSSNGILFVEFNTNQYGSLFLNLHKNNVKSFYYGRKRPAIWNLKSLSIIKNSKCTVITEHVLWDNKLKKRVKEDSEKFLIKTMSILKDSSFFEEFFSFNNISFWNIIKPSFFDLCERRIKESIQEINLAKKVLEKFQPKGIMVLSESGYTEQFMLNQAKKFDIPIFLIQHGVGAYDSPKSDVINEFTGSLPCISNEYLVWGSAAENYAKRFGTPETKIKVLGSPAHDNTFEKSNKKTELKNEFVLLATGFAAYKHVNDYTIKANEEYEKTFKEICNTISKAKKQLIVKIHPYIDGKNETKIAKQIDPTIKVLKKGDMISLVESCKLMITLSMTSAILDAQILEKPVIRIPLREWWGAPDTHRPSPGLTVKVEDFEEIFKKIMTDKKFHQQVINDGKKFVNACLSNHGKANTQIAMFLKNYFN